MIKWLAKNFGGVDIDNRDERVYLALRNYWFFCFTYFSHYFFLKPAPFHQKLINVICDVAIEMVAVIGFRGSAKSTHLSMAFPIWKALRTIYDLDNDHFIILICDTSTQRDINIENIKSELEENELLRNDFRYHLNQNKRLTWRADRLELTNVFILGRSRGQKVRGLRYHQFRPSLVIGDDLEDLEWVRKKANRDKTERWLTSEVIPAIEETKAKLIIIGNLLHSDALMSRLKRSAVMTTLEFPLVKDGKVSWLSKYPTKKAYEKQKARIISNTAWQREYLLKIVPEDGQVVTEEDLQYYDCTHNKLEQLRLYCKDAGIGIDLAISEKESADHTAMVPGFLMSEGGKDVLYISPDIFHGRVDLDDTIKEAQLLSAKMPVGTRYYVESNAYQLATPKAMKRRGLPAVAVRSVKDKRARLETASLFIKSGQVKFPSDEGKGKIVSDLIDEIIGFGIEEHDDLMDAIVHLILAIFDKKKATAGTTNITKV